MASAVLLVDLAETVTYSMELLMVAVVVVAAQLLLLQMLVLLLLHTVETVEVAEAETRAQESPVCQTQVVEVVAAVRAVH
jgi:hypothetical protein